MCGGVCLYVCLNDLVPVFVFVFLYVAMNLEETVCLREYACE